MHHAVHDNELVRLDVERRENLVIGEQTSAKNEPYGGIRDSKVAANFIAELGYRNFVVKFQKNRAPVEFPECEFGFRHLAEFDFLCDTVNFLL